MHVGHRVQKFVRSPVIEESFWRLVNRLEGENACWPWLGQMRYHNGEHTPWFKYKKTSMSAPRYAWQSTSNEYLAPSKRLVRRCGEPLCVRPEHRVPVALGGSKSNEQILVEAETRAKEERLRAEAADRVVAVKSPVELQESQKAALYASALSKEVATLRSALAGIPQLLVPILTELATLKTELAALRSESSALKGVPKDLRVIGTAVMSIATFVNPRTAAQLDQIASDVASLRQLSDQPAEPQTPALSANTAALSANEQVAETPVPAPAAPPNGGNGKSVTTIVEPAAEFTAVLGIEPIGLTDEHNINIVAQMASNQGGGPKVSRDRLSAWMRTFRSLVSSGVLDATSAQFVEAAKAGLFGTAASG